MGVILPDPLLDMIREWPKEDQIDGIDAIVDYARDGVVPGDDAPIIARAAFKAFKAFTDESNEKYEKKRRAGEASGAARRAKAEAKRQAEQPQAPEPEPVPVPVEPEPVQAPVNTVEQTGTALDSARTKALHCIAKQSIAECEPLEADSYQVPQAGVVTPPTLDEVIEYFEMTGGTRAMAEKFFHTYNGKKDGWANMGDWHSKATVWKLNDQAGTYPGAPRGQPNQQAPARRHDVSQEAMQLAKGCGMTPEQAQRYIDDHPECLTGKGA